MTISFIKDTALKYTFKHWASVIIPFAIFIYFINGSKGFHTMGATVLAYQSQNCSSGQKPSSWENDWSLKKKSLKDWNVWAEAIVSAIVMNFRQKWICNVMKFRQK